MPRQSKPTRQRIQQAMLTLLPEKPYPAITIEDLAQQAGCSRMTIHRHFGDKENLLLTCFEATVEEIKEGLMYPKETPGQSAAQIAYANILAFYTHVADNQALYRALFTTTTGSSIRSRFRRYMVGGTLNVMGQVGTLDIMPPPANVVVNLLADMMVGAIIWWLETDSTLDPAVLAEIALRLAETGFFGLTGQVVTEEDISFRPFSVNW